MLTWPLVQGVVMQGYVEKPLINMIRIGKCRQAILYKGIFVLRFSCGCLGHTQDNCWYNIKQSEKYGEHDDNPKAQEVKSQLWAVDVGHKETISCS